MTIISTKQILDQFLRYNICNLDAYHPEYLPYIQKSFRPSRHNLHKLCHHPLCAKQKFYFDFYTLILHLLEFQFYLIVHRYVFHIFHNLPLVFCQNHFYSNIKHFFALKLLQQIMSASTCTCFFEDFFIN